MSWYSADALAAVWAKIKDTRGREGRKPPPVGIDGVTAEIFDSRLPQHLAEISRQLGQKEQNGTRPTRYRFAPWRKKTISSEPGKLREICIPRIRDQIVLRAVADQVLARIEENEPQFLDTSPRQAVKRVIATRGTGCRQVLRTDISNYYPSIPHQPLLDLVRGLDLDERVMDLASLVLVTPFRDMRLGKESDGTPERGIPIGISLSTLLAEYYLAKLHHQFSQQGTELIRYVDDLILLAMDEDTLKTGAGQLFEAIQQLQLDLSPSKTTQGSFEQGFEFLGFAFLGDQVLVAEAKSMKWLRVYQGIARKFINNIDQAPSENEALEYLRLMVHEINREVSGSCGMQVPYYSLADDLTPFRRLDRQLRQVIGGIFRRLGQKMNGPYRIESAYSWAWKYKRGHDDALAAAKSKFPQIEVDSIPANS